MTSLIKHFTEIVANTPNFWEHHLALAILAPVGTLVGYCLYRYTR